MNRFFVISLVLIVCLTSGRIIAADSAKTQAFLDTYYARLAQFRSERAAHILAKHPDWKDAISKWREMYAADDALYRGVFIYYQQKRPGILQWSDGEWFESVFVCSCGQEGRVPIADFDRLLKARGEAEEAFRNALGKFDAFRKISEALSDAPSLQDSNIRFRLADLESDFDAILKTPNQRLQGTPESVPSSSTEPEARRS